MGYKLSMQEVRGLQASICVFDSVYVGLRECSGRADTEDVWRRTQKAELESRVSLGKTSCVTYEQRLGSA